MRFRRSTYSRRIEPFLHVDVIRAEPRRLVLSIVASGGQHARTSRLFCLPSARTWFPPNSNGKQNQAGKHRRISAYSAFNPLPDEAAGICEARLFHVKRPSLRRRFEKSREF